MVWYGVFGPLVCRVGRSISPLSYLDFGWFGLLLHCTHGLLVVRDHTVFHKCLLLWSCLCTLHSCDVWNISQSSKEDWLTKQEIAANDGVRGQTSKIQRIVETSNYHHSSRRKILMHLRLIARQCPKYHAFCRNKLNRCLVSRKANPKLLSARNLHKVHEKEGNFRPDDLSGWSNRWHLSTTKTKKKCKAQTEIHNKESHACQFCLVLVNSERTFGSRLPWLWDACWPSHAVAINGNKSFISFNSSSLNYPTLQSSWWHSWSQLSLISHNLQISTERRAFSELLQVPPKIWEVTS